MHCACYRADASVRAIIHTHAPALTALGIRGAGIEEMLPEAAEAIGGVTSLPQLPSGSTALGRSVARTVAEGSHLVILQNHGAVAVGSSLSDAYDRMELAELSAKTVLLATP